MNILFYINLAVGMVAFVIAVVSCYNTWRGAGELPALDNS